MEAQANPVGWRLFRGKPEALLAAVWCLPAAALAGFLSMRLGAWGLAGSTFLILGSPAGMLLGRVLLWGWVFAALFEDISIIQLSAAGFALDLLLLQVGHVLFRANATFFLTELFAIGICLVPAQLFARWTRQRSHLAVRNVMHLIFHGALFLAIWPLLIMQFCGGNWQAWAERSSAVNKLYLQLLVIPCVLLITAMQEFHMAGRGTPMPQDAPRNLVTTGIYAYVSNPMQIGKFGVLFGWGFFWRNPFIVAAAFLGLLYSVTIARWREDRDLTARFGTAWTKYRQNVSRWWPRWRPWIAPRDAGDSAALFLDLDCGPCAILARWLAGQRPQGLRILPLSAHRSQGPARITYQPAGEHHEVYGIKGIARALEHIHLFWAFCGWMLRLPLIAWCAELISSAVSPLCPERCPRASGQAVV